jgi:hypothetical protein
MHIIDYKYIRGTELKDGIVTIPELNREKPAVRQFIDLNSNLNLELTRPTAFIFIEGTTVSQGETGLGKAPDTSFRPALKSTSVNNAHAWCSEFKNIEWLQSMEIVHGTCASSIEAINLASSYLMSSALPIEEVIIIGHERISMDTVRLFKEVGVPVTCGDGFVFMRLEHGHDIAGTKWKWVYHQNPFHFTREDLDTLIPTYRIGYVKLHGTGTESNTEAEAGLAGVATPLTYKEEIGHTQGVSALLETCLVLDDPKIRGRILVTANGLGGYYGAFTLTKPNARNE